MPFDTVDLLDVAATKLLIRAHFLLKHGWCVNALALDGNGQPVDPRSECAVQWCPYGALLAAEESPTTPAFDAALRRLHAQIPDASGYAAFDIGAFNKRQETVEPILAAFDRAIAAGGH